MLETLTNCPVCNSTKHQYFISVISHHDGAWRLCECGAAFLSPRMDEEELTEFYRSGMYRDLIERDDDDFKDARIEMQQRGAYIAGLMSKSVVRSHLDIGCASGELLQAIAATHPGVFSMGVDADPVLTTKDFVVAPTLAEVDREFDLITIIQTLEHMNDPIGVMNMIRDRLVVGGAVMIEVPNRRAWEVAYFAPQHVVAYDEKSLLKLLSGWNIKLVLPHGKPAGRPIDLNILVVATK
jgi:2-polyprenyl-3-methyl-5-hydroxy-6-metoxy-1,4-benzoquinol methylase